MYRSVPLRHPEPDAGEFVEILAGRSSSARVPLVEYIIDDVVMRPIVIDLLGREWVDCGSERDQLEKYLDNVIATWYHLGYDVVRFELSLPFKERATVIQDAAPGSPKQRSWPDEHHGTITSWEEFEQYIWPSVEAFDFYPFEYLNDHLPDGMGLISCHGGGVFEHLSWIMSLEGLSMALHEQPELVASVTDALGERMTGFYRHLLDLDRLVAIFPGDDMGYRSATIVSPAALRTYVLPWHGRFSAMAHGQGRPYYLHSCGNVTGIMEDLIVDVKIDGKHSYEDVITPVQEFQKQYGNRIAILGGVDLNILSGSPPDDVRRHVRFLLETCGRRGRYAMGSGNSIPSYVPVANYLAMIDETHSFNSNLA